MRSICGGAWAWRAGAWLVWAAGMAGTGGCLLLSPGDYACTQDADCVAPYRCNAATGTCDTRAAPAGSSSAPAASSQGASSGSTTGSSTSHGASSQASSQTSSGTSSSGQASSGSTSGAVSGSSTGASSGTPPSSGGTASSGGLPSSSGVAPSSQPGSSSSGGLSSSGLGSSSSACQACTLTSQCAAPANACLLAQCLDSGCCGTRPVMDGVEAEVAQTPGDCQAWVCNGMGGLRSADDPDDVPDTAPQCMTTPRCEGTPLRPTYQPQLPGRPCTNGICGDGAATGTCVDCNDAGDCPTPNNACLEAVCTDHVCDTQGRTGMALAMQTPGDCQRQVCTALGGTTSVDDATDPPLSSPECQTSPTCSGSPLAPSFSPSSPGVMCTGGVCGAGATAGQCVACNVPADCPDTGNECVARTCQSNQCGTMNLGVETPLSLQQSGDCQRAVCSGSGGTTSVDDPMDTPTAASVCQTMPRCSGTPLAPAFTPAATTVACATPSFSGRCGDGTAPGQCVQCNVAADCPATGNECVVRTCTNHMCGTSNRGNSFVTTTGQVPGDCRKRVCNGAGGTTLVDDATDLPTSTTVCRTPQCTGMPLAPSFANAAAGTDCAADMMLGLRVCGDETAPGQCVACNGDADCPAGACVSHACQ